MAMDFGKIWLESGWTKEARLIIEGIKKFPAATNLIMFLRHSHREAILNVEHMANLGLTEQGKQIARIFGSKLPLDKSIRIYYSTVTRCKETAESIIDGFEDAGGKGKLIGPFKPLFFIEGEGEYIVKQIFDNPDKELINRWAAGHFPEEKIQPLHKYSQETAKKIFNMNKEAPNNSIDIYLTHDLQIMALRFSWFGLDPCTYWVSYLGGFVLLKNEHNTKLLNNGKIQEVKAPHWWI